MKKIFFFFLLSICILETSAQTLIENGQSSLEVKKAKKNGKWEVHTSRYFISVADNEKKVQVRIKLESQTGDHVIIDPNKFFVLVDEYKIRVRPMDLKYPFALASIAFVRLIKENEYGRGNTVRGGYARDGSIVDTFGDYAISGYQDIETTLNYGTEKKPILKTIYYKPNDIKNSLIDIYFALPKDVTQFSFYYGEIKIDDLTVK
ncbi:MAG: hypothetical protein K8F54_00985 [Altibacter sp.]|uniref:hypothetical protein n=1 Tax=Altibacter sp. TaxID=2024823 RepID=UPI001DD135FF|nr:hypothetical protein [Altibacter sp.]MBZ0326152.1 hypothetical protein [Altibacter sp.]